MIALTVLIEHDPDYNIFCAYIPELPGVTAIHVNRDEAIRLVEAAAVEDMAMRLKLGLAPMEPRFTVAAA